MLLSRSSQAHARVRSTKAAQARSSRARVSTTRSTTDVLFHFSVKTLRKRSPSSSDSRVRSWPSAAITSSIESKYL